MQLHRVPASGDGLHSGNLLLVPTSGQFKPLVGEQFIDIAAFQLTQTPSGQDNDIQVSQFPLMEAKGFPNMPFDSITAGSFTDIFFGDHQPQPGVVKLILASQYQQMATTDLDIRTVENLLKISC